MTPLKPEWAKFFKYYLNSIIRPQPVAVNYGYLGRLEQNGWRTLYPDPDNTDIVYVEFDYPGRLTGSHLAEWPRNRIMPYVKILPAMPVKLLAINGMLDMDYRRYLNPHTVSTS